MRHQLLAASAVCALAMAHQAQAAEAAAPANEADPTVEAIVVTGEKATRSLQDTVTSVSVTTAAQIERAQVRTLYDVVNRTANMSDTFAKAGFTIRGVSDTNVSGGGTGGLATVYFDGTALPRAAVYSGPLSAWDIQQIEVLRGPQSTLQGFNSLAGAVMIRSQDPTYDWSWRARATAATGDERSLALAGGGPIVDDQLAFRLAVEKVTADGFIYNPTRGEDADPLESIALRGKLLMTPEAVPGLRILTTYSHNERKSGYLFVYARTDVPDYYDHRVDLSNDRNRTDDKVDIFTVESSYDINDRLKVTGLASWNRVDSLTTYDLDYSAAPLANVRRKQDIDTATQELRVNYEGERLRGLVGFYHSRRDIEDRLAGLTNTPFPTATLTGALTAQLLAGVPNPTPVQIAAAQAQAGAFATLYATALPFVPVDYSGDQPEVIETTAVFADGAFAITPQLSLLAGFRYDHEVNTSAVSQAANFVGAYPDPAAFGPFAIYVPLVNQFVASLVAQADADAPRTKRSFNAFLPKVGLKYEWTPDISTSIVAQRAYRSGGSYVNIARSTVTPYDQEYTWNYEASLRTAWLDGALTVNANAFYVDWKDQQVVVNLGLSPYDTQVENAGRSHLYGFEVEVAHRVDDRFSWYASLGHTRTKFEDFTVSTGTTVTQLAGSQFPYAPHWTLAAGADYRWDNGLVAHLDGAYRSKAYSRADVTQATTAVVKERVLVNGRFGYEQAHWGAYVFGKNLLNEKYQQYTQLGAPLALLGDPRVIGVSLEARW